jgi:mono/diheme cytochrome c family protein
MSISMRTRVYATCVVMAGGMLWVGLGVASAQAPDPAKVALGAKTLEDTKCEKCHGSEGMGNKDKKLSLVGVSPKMSAADIRKWIVTPEAMTAKLPRQPIEPMKKFDLTEAQVDALVAYVQSLKK